MSTQQLLIELMLQICCAALADLQLYIQRRKVLTGSSRPEWPGPCRKAEASHTQAACQRLLAKVQGLSSQHSAAQSKTNVLLQVRLEGWQLQEAGGLETQLLAGHDGFADLDPLAVKDVHAGIVQLRHTDAAEGVALGALDIAWSRARYCLFCFILCTALCH